MKKALGIVCASLFVMAAVGCSKGNLEDRVCEHVMAMEELGVDSREECDEGIADIADDCSNPDDVYECILEADSMQAFAQCESVCDES